MPILRLPKNDDPLTQGDILSGLHLYATGRDWADRGSPERLDPCDLSLVISRPCAIIHKRQILVAAVKPKKEKPQDVETFEKVKDFLTRLRDGYRRSDRFYLGQIPDLSEGRYCAHLDSLHTVAVPPPDELEQFLKHGRIATLGEEFRRDLHVRIFFAVADLGFSDFGWYSGEDLSWLARKGREKLHDMRREPEGKGAELAEFRASGEAKTASHLDNLKRNITNLQADVREFEEELKSYEGELNRRNDAE